MDFKLGKGPWQVILQGMFQEHEMEILQNPESMILVLVFEKQGNKKTGVVMQCFKVFSADGSLEGFIDKAKTDSISLIKHVKKTDYRFFLLSSNPAYANHEEEEVQKETNFLMDSIANNARIVKGMALATGVKLKELHEVSEETQRAFFSQPLGLATLYTAREAMPMQAGETVSWQIQI